MRRVVGAMLACALLAGACGDDESTPAGPSPTTTAAPVTTESTPPADGTLAISVGFYYFVRQNYPIFNGWTGFATPSKTFPTQSETFFSIFG